jgi:hypothetical protein
VRKSKSTVGHSQETEVGAPTLRNYVSRLWFASPICANCAAELRNAEWRKEQGHSNGFFNAGLVAFVSYVSPQIALFGSDHCFAQGAALLANV